MLSDRAEPGACRAPASCCPYSSPELPEPSKARMLQDVCSGGKQHPGPQDSTTSATAQWTRAEETSRSTRGTSPHTTKNQGGSSAPALERQKACTAHGASRARNRQLAQIYQHLPRAAFATSRRENEDQSSNFPTPQQVSSSFLPQCARGLFEGRGEAKIRTFCSLETASSSENQGLWIGQPFYY